MSKKGGNEFMFAINQYDQVKLRTGKYAVIVEVLDENKAFIADIEIEEGDFETETIFYNDIAALIVKVEMPLAQMDAAS